jgi:hypothetical protein
MTRASPILACAAVVLLPGGVLSQEPSQVGAALEAACGVGLDPSTEAVIVRTVTDSISGVVLPGVTVRILWRTPADTADVVLEAETDAKGIFGFCGLPGGVRATLQATLRITSEPLEVDLEAGTLHVEPIRLKVSSADSRVRLMGRVVDPAAGAPVMDAQVRLVELNERTMTNAGGFFNLGDQPWGVFTLEVTGLGYAPLATEVRLGGDFTQVVELHLTPDALVLEGITVNVAPQPSPLQIHGLDRRRALGFGNVFLRETLEQRPGARVADILQEVPGMVVRRGLYGAVWLEVRGRFCVPAVWVDGVLWIRDHQAGLNLSTTEIEVVEVYRGVQIPLDFMAVGRGSSSCAVIAVWTRRWE